MTSGISEIVIDCADPYALSLFWAQVTGWVEDPDEPNEAGTDFAYLESPTGLGLLFQQVPEAKSVKNRVHLDVSPDDRTRDEEVARLVELGATQIGDFREADGTGWVVMADPEHNEFCVLRSDAERAVTPAH